MIKSINKYAMIVLSIGWPVKRPWVLLDVSCSTREVSYITLAIDYFERMNMLKYCKLLKIKLKNIRDETEVK